MSNATFIKIGDVRIRIGTIKRYQPVDDVVICIRFNTNINNKQVEVYRLNSTEERDSVIDKLDSICIK